MPWVKASGWIDTRSMETRLDSSGVVVEQVQGQRTQLPCTPFELP